MESFLKLDTHYKIFFIAMTKIFCAVIFLFSAGLV